jgi:hypothetical protein
MAQGYPPEFTCRVVELAGGGRKVAELAADLGITTSVYSRLRLPQFPGGLGCLIMPLLRVW